MYKVCKNNESSHLSAKETACKANNIFEKHIITGQNKGGNSEGTRFIDYLICKHGVCHKQVELLVPTRTEHRVFGITGKFSPNDFSSLKRKNRQVTDTVRGIDKQPSNCNNQISTTVEEAIIFSLGGLARMLTPEISIAISFLALRELSYASKIYIR